MLQNQVLASPHLIFWNMKPTNVSTSLSCSCWLLKHCCWFLSQKSLCLDVSEVTLSGDNLRSERKLKKNKICLSTDIFIYIFYKINLIFSKYTIIKRCTLQKKKVTRNSIYTHRIIYYFGRQERGPVQCKQLVTPVQFSLSLLRAGSRYIQNSKKCALRNLFQQSVLFVSLSAE